MTYTQQDRICRFATVLGEDSLLLQSLRGEEAISRPFEFKLELVSEDGNIPASRLLGTRALVAIELADGSERYLHGIITGLERGADYARFTRYVATLRPWFSLLGHRTDCRIFQQMSVPEIVKNVFREAGYTDFEGRLVAEYEKRVYCVQYRESDSSFVQRLLEEEGIFYFFEHSQSTHKLILADAPATVPTCRGQETAYFQHSAGAEHAADEIIAWSRYEEIFSGTHATKDFNFEDPANPLHVGAFTRHAVGHNHSLEVYDYHPEDYRVESEGLATAKVRMEEHELGAIRIVGQSECRAFGAGTRFTLEDHSSAAESGKGYTLVSVSHSLIQPSPFAPADGPSVSYTNHFTCIPADMPYRHPRTTPKPRIRGPQTAIVVGPPGEEIYVDQHGRVKVQFHWDRRGKRDERSSCWIRVAQTWAGKQWGALANPRIHDEVIVEFLEGDPDKPMVTGCVYNARHVPPYDLPANKTQTGIKSRSSPGGSPANFNEIRLEDKKGQEQVYIQAEKDLQFLIKHDHSGSVGHDEQLSVGNNRSKSVAADETTKIGGDRTETVEGSESVTIGGDQTIVIGANGSEQITANKVIGAGSSIVLKAGVSITLQCGAGTIHMNQAGVISITGTMLMLNAAVSAMINAPLVMTTGLAVLNTGALTMSTGVLNKIVGGTTTIDGAPVRINS